MVKLKVENETKEQKFKRIASGRTNRVLNDLRLLGNCSNRNIYSYSKEDTDKIFGAIQREVKRARSMFDTTKTEFSLD
jgi:hypothetical protein